MSDAQEHWIRLTALLPHDDAVEGRIAVLLQAAGSPGVNVQDPGTMDGADIPEGWVRLVAYYEADTATGLGDVRASLLQLGIEGLEVALEDYTDTGWRDGWKAYFRPAQVSPRLAVRAPWSPFDPAAGVEVLVIEPGIAFGTGTHETTRLCLAAIDRLTGNNGISRIIDIGCGSGVLSIAAAKLGYTDVFGIDNDPIAVEISRENAELNQVECRFADTPAADVPGTWPLVVANILSSILLSLRDAIVERCDPGGVIVLSGLLATETKSLADVFCRGGACAVRSTKTMGEWACLELVRSH